MVEAELKQQLKLLHDEKDKIINDFVTSLLGTRLAADERDFDFNLLIETVREAVNDAFFFEQDELESALMEISEALENNEN